MRHRLLATLAATGTVAAVAAVPMTATATPPAQSAASSKTIVGVAAGDPQFSTLVSLVKQAGLATTLSKGSYTVFAPTNAAFAKVPKATLTALGKDKAKLKAVLLSTWSRAASGLEGRQAHERQAAQQGVGEDRGQGPNVFLNGSTKVTKTDVKASNGIIHVINKVLLPPARQEGTARAGKLPQRHLARPGPRFTLYSEGTTPSKEPDMAGTLSDVTDSNFQAEVLESDVPVLVDFWAPWCGPSRVVAPVLEEIAAERSDLQVVQLGIDEEPADRRELRVLSIPTLILFKNGAVARKVIGAYPSASSKPSLGPR